MPSPAKKNLTVYRGSNAPVLQFRLRNPDGSLQNLTGVDFVLMVEAVDGAIVASLSGGGITIDDTGLLSWAPTLEQSRKIRLGPNTPYAVERIFSGTQYPVIIGLLNGVDYINADL